MRKYRNYAMVFGIVGLLFILTGVTFAFFNYTRVGSVNLIKTGNISFDAEQGTSFNLTNVFPIEANATNLADNTKAGILNIHVTGSTDYNEGIEYVISTVDVNNTAGKKTIPISIDVNYTASNGKSIGEADIDYFDNHGGDDSIYKVLTKNVLKDEEKLVVGYIKPDENGIDGNITITAYIDKDKVAVSDTYPQNTSHYVYNNEMTNTEFTNCVDYFLNLYAHYTEESATRMCNGETAYIYSSDIQTVIDYADEIVSMTSKPSNMSQSDFEANQEFYSEYLTDLLAINVIKEVDYYNETEDEWVDGRTVLTTSEWNSLQENGVSFKIKVEANEGIWVESSTTIGEQCPNCVFGYPTSSIYTTWNSENQSPSVITTGWTDNYHDLVSSTNKNNFVGVIKNENNQIERAFVCVIRDDYPICIESTADGSKTSANHALIEEYYEPYYILESSDSWGAYLVAFNRDYDIGDDLYMYDYGFAESFDNDYYCMIDSTGEIFCGSY